MLRVTKCHVWLCAPHLCRPLIRKAARALNTCMPWPKGQGLSPCGLTHTQHRSCQACNLAMRYVKKASSMPIRQPTHQAGSAWFLAGIRRGSTNERNESKQTQHGMHCMLAPRISVRQAFNTHMPQPKTTFKEHGKGSHPETRNS